MNSAKSKKEKKKKKKKKKKKEKKTKLPSNRPFVNRFIFSTAKCSISVARGLALWGSSCFACPTGALVVSDAKCKLAKQTNKCLVLELSFFIMSCLLSDFFEFLSFVTFFFGTISDSSLSCSCL